MAALLRNGLIKSVGLSALLSASLAITSACTDGDEGAQEPVAPGDEMTGYPEDPALAGEGADEMPSDPIEEPAAEGEDLPGALTDEPFGNPPSGDDSEIADTGDAAVPDEAPSGDTYGDSFDDKPAYDPSTGSGPDVADTTMDEPSVGLDAGDASMDSGVTDDTGSASGSTRYVNAMLLNVRSSPSLRAPIVRRLLGGARVTATVQGQWAKINNGQWVRSKYLSRQPTKRVSREEVTRAWARSKYKDTWQPPR